MLLRAITDMKLWKAMISEPLKGDRKEDKSTDYCKYHTNITCFSVATV